MLVAVAIMLVGITTIALLSQRRGYRLGGVMAIPLLTIYTIREPLSPVIYVVGVIGALGGLWAIREYTLNHGRRVFLVAVLTGVCVTVSTAYAIDAFTPARLSYRDAEVVASIFPGVTAYNTMRLDREDRVEDVLGMVAVFGGLLLFGVGGLIALEGRALPVPPLLALPTSDLVTLLGIETSGRPTPHIVPDWLSLSLLVADVAVYEAVRKRYDLRLVGIIVVPLVAVFSVRFQYAIAVFVLGLVALFVSVAVIHWLSLLYGRVLLAVSLVLGLCYALAFGVVVDRTVPGILLFFTGLLAGVAAYNVYRVSPTVRAASLRTSAGLFVLSYALVAAVVEVPPYGLAADGTVWYLLAGAAALTLSGVELSRLERSRPPVADFARASVFASIDVDGVDDESLFSETRGGVRRWIRSLGGSHGAEEGRPGADDPDSEGDAAQP